MSKKYKFKEKEGAYFVTFGVVYWIDVFTRLSYFDLLIDSLDFCRKNKGMEIYGYCIMPNHVHLIFRSSNAEPSALMRDFKGFTARKMLKAIKENPQESRKKWLLWMFKKAGDQNSNISESQFWQQGNHPIEIWSLKVFRQKLRYIHENPVKSGFVINPIYYRYSSAWNYALDDHTILEIDLNQ